MKEELRNTGISAEPSGAAESPFSTRTRVGQLIFLSLAVLATLGLAYWQWTSWQSGGGSFRNLGYAIQWPIFGVFLIVAYRKYVQYERERRLGEESPAVQKGEPEQRDAEENIAKVTARYSRSKQETMSFDQLKDTRRRDRRRMRAAGGGGVAPHEEPGVAQA